MTTYYLPIFKKEDYTVSEFDIDDLLREYSFECGSILEDHLGMVRTYSIDHLNPRHKETIEAHVFPDGKAEMSVSDRSKPLAALLVFQNFSKMLYSEIEADVRSGKLYSKP